MFNNFFSEIPALYWIMWKNVVEPDRPQMTIKDSAGSFHSGYLGI
jgi:hypothetical protein